MMDISEQVNRDSLHVGSMWVKKKNHKHVAKVVLANIDYLSAEIDYVWLDMPWTKNGEGGKCIDTFFKQYSPVSPDLDALARSLYPDK